jgi:hypothetical protein
MARFIGAPTRCVPWGLWIWFKVGRDYETSCRFDRPEDAENYARHRLADCDEVEQFALLRRRPGKRERTKFITRHNQAQPPTSPQREEKKSNGEF